MAARPKVNVQGRFEVRRGGKDPDDDLFITYPDGTIGVAQNEEYAEASIRRWAKSHMDRKAFNVAMIDWFDGLKPPGNP